MLRLLQRSTLASVRCRHTAAAIIPTTRTTTPLIQPSYRIQSRLFSTVPPSPSSSTQSTPSSDANANSSKKPEDDEEFDEEPQAKKKQGPQAVTWKSVTFLVVVGGVTVAYLLWNQERALNTVRMDSIGTPKIGGPWSLTNDQGKRVTSADLHGKYPLIYFGFTHCPDICPRELERMDEVIQKIDAAKLGHHIVPLFITIDPKRDTVARMREYKKKWNPRIQFLVPTDEELKDLSAKFRLYYSASETNPGEEDDYLLDHSIFFYMMDREGKFMDVFSQYTTTDDVAFKIASNIKAENK